jgi:uncharacterized protein (TIGR02246 family)
MPSLSLLKGSSRVRPVERKTMTSDTAPIRTGADGAIRMVFDEVSAAWADGDVDAFVSSYTEDATVVLPGVYLPGRDAIHAAMADAFAGPLHDSRRIHELQAIRFPRTGTAIVISKSATAFSGEGELPAQRWEWATWVLARHDDRWLIEAYHSCPQIAGSATETGNRDGERATRRIG